MDQSCRAFFKNKVYHILAIKIILHGVRVHFKGKSM